MVKYEDIIDDADLYVNKIRLPICFCLDVGSDNDKNGDYIKKLNEIIELFYKLIKENEYARPNIETCIVSFASDINIEQDFCLCDNRKTLNLSLRKGPSDISAGGKKSIDLINTRKQLYKEHTMEYYCPILFVFSNGRNHIQLDENFIEEMKNLQEKHRLNVFCLALDDGADKEVFKLFSKKVGIYWDNFFNDVFYLGKSGDININRNHNEKVPLPVENLDEIFDIDV